MRRAPTLEDASQMGELPTQTQLVPIIRTSASKLTLASLCYGIIWSTICSFGISLPILFIHSLIQGLNLGRDNFLHVLLVLYGLGFISICVGFCLTLFDGKHRRWLLIVSALCTIFTFVISFEVQEFFEVSIVVLIGNIFLVLATLNLGIHPQSLCRDFAKIVIFIMVYMLFYVLVANLACSTPMLYLAFPSILGLLSGPLLIFFMARERKAWVLLIAGILNPLILRSYKTYLLIIGALLVMFIAEMIRRSGSYRSVARERLAFAVFNCWSCFCPVTVLLMPNAPLQESIVLGGLAKSDTLMRLITWPNIALAFLGALVFGYLGAFIGSKLLKKQLLKASIA
ncbi:MAG: MptD family putative ECF transporter S component [Eubacteriales bacterium]|nr:MptD family putative ECF transporter S component [Eubacteriales bacterium]